MGWGARRLSQCVTDPQDCIKPKIFMIHRIHEICDYDLPIVIYYINYQITEILLFKRSVIIFRKGKSLQKEVYYNFVTVC